MWFQLLFFRHSWVFFFVFFIFYIIDDSFLSQFVFFAPFFSMSPNLYLFLILTSFLGKGGKLWTSSVVRGDFAAGRTSIYSSKMTFGYYKYLTKSPLKWTSPRPDCLCEGENFQKLQKDAEHSVKEALQMLHLLRSKIKTRRSCRRSSLLLYLYHFCSHQQLYK